MSIRLRNKAIWPIYGAAAIVFSSQSLTLLDAASWIEQYEVTKSYSWGEIATKTTSDKIHLRIRLTPLESEQTSAPSSVDSFSSVGGKTFLVSPVLLRRTFYLGIPSGSTLNILRSAIKSRPAEMGIPIVLTGYSQSADTAAIMPLIKSVEHVRMKLDEQPLTIDGYEWFRGSRIARLSIAPIVSVSSSVDQLEEIDATLHISNVRSDRIISPVADTLFNVVREKLIANHERESAQKWEPLLWSDTTGTWIVPGQEYLKLAIGSDGIYRLTYDDLQQQVSFLESIDPTTFQLFKRGKEIPLVVSTAVPGMLQSGDYLEFPGVRNYGQRHYRSIPTGTEEYPEYLDRYTDTSYYWLTWGGIKGLRAPTNSGMIPSPDTLTWYTETVHIEKDNYIQFVGGDIAVHQDPRWLPGDMWAWQFLGAGGTVNVNFAATNIATEYPTVKVFARFASWAAQNVTPAHRARLRLNNSDTLQAINLQPYEHALMADEAPIGTLVNGTNTIRLHSLPTTSTVNFLLFDWADAEYPRRLVATGDTLLFGFTVPTVAGVKTIRISGLTTPDLVVLKYQPDVKKIAEYSKSPTSPYTVTFVDSVRPGDRYMLSSRSKVRRPEIRGLKKFINLREPSRKSDYLLITHKLFLPTAQQYTSFIGQAYKIQTSVIDVQDVFDEFGYGYPTPESIREFFKATTRWQAPMPSYVLLAGDATYDYKFVMGDPNPANRPFNSVPSLGNPVSDPWLVTLDDNSILPQMYVGRITVGSQSDFQRYSQRVQSYLALRNDDWNKRYLFFTGGDPLIPGQIESFKNVNESIITTMVEPAPIGGVGTNFYKTVTPQSDFGPHQPDVIRSALDNGGVFVCYIGHSGTQTWDNGVGEPSQLQNKRGRFALVSDFGCSTARFAEPDIKAFGELFTLGETGSAIAYVGNSALGFTSIALGLPPVFYKQFLADGIAAIGPAHLRAKIERVTGSGGPGILLNRIMMQTNSLLGDPILELAIPRKPNLSVASSHLKTIPSQPTDDDETVQLTIPYVNSGSVLTDSFLVSISHTYAGGRIDTSLSLRLPRFLDTLKVRLLVKDRPGEHTLNVQFNPTKRVEELRSDDNTAELRLIVLSNALKIVSPAPGFEQNFNEMVFLNPANYIPGSGSRVFLELDSTGSFQNPLRFIQGLGTVVTRIATPGLRPGSTYSWRVNLENSIRPWSEGQTTLSSESGIRWKQRGSAWAENTYSDAKYETGTGVRLTDKSVALRVTSSGFIDGGFGAVELNGVNVLPNTFARGHTVVILDTLDITVKTIRTFDLFGNGANAESLRVFLNALPAGSIIAQVIIDDGGQSLSPGAKTAIKAFGSRWIDSVRFRDSWAMIGRKGAPIGSVPEEWRRTFAGRVIIDTTFVRKLTWGEVVSATIGPVGKWVSASFTGNTPGGSTLTATIIGMKIDFSADSLLRMQTSGTIDLSAINPRVYPYLKLHVKLNVGPGGVTPVLTDWTVSVLPPAELALNYQSVNLNQETVLEGEPLALNATLLNAGSSPADSFFVALTSTHEGKGPTWSDTVLVVSIAPGASFGLTKSIPTTGRAGKNSVRIELDIKNRIPEVYRTNNVFVVPYLVATDTIRPTFDITFDGVRIFDGDYVSVRPEIRLRLFDNSALPISDPSSVTLTLDGRRIVLGSFPDSLFQAKMGSEKAEVVVRPMLQQGDHLLSVRVRDASGNFADTLGGQIRFRVELRSRILNVVNVPNPFRRETVFTFNLVGSGLPDELIIKIYSVAGRLLRELKFFRSELRIGFNHIEWDGTDQDGSVVANGVYFYKVSMRIDDRVEEVVEKLAKVE